jgi:hypothetical protein
MYTKRPFRAKQIRKWESGRGNVTVRKAISMRFWWYLWSSKRTRGSGAGEAACMALSLALIHSAALSARGQCALAFSSM